MTDHAHPFTATADGERLAAYDALNAQGPVHRMALPFGDEVWMVTGYEAARAALLDPRLLKGPEGSGPYTDLLPADVTGAVDQHLLALDPPDHGRLRRLVSAAFTRRRTELLAPRIQELTDELLDAMARRRGEVELITEFAYPLPITVISELLGIPAADRYRFRRWSAPLLAGRQAGFEAYSTAITEFVQYLRELLAAKRRDPADDLLSALVAVRDADDRLSENELTSMAFLLVVAGHETTVNLITNGVRALLAQPDQLAVLRAEPDRMEAAVEELLRFDGPLQSALPVQAAEDLELAGVRIAAGDTVVISLLAANRDPARLPNGDRLDVTRPEISHLAFGHGIHHCLGAPLARLEGRIALRSLITRFPDLRLAVPAADLTRTAGLLLNGLVELPVLLGDDALVSGA